MVSVRRSGSFSSKPQRQRFERQRRGRIEFRGTRRLLAQHLSEQARGILVVEGQPTAQDLEQDDAERVDVAALVDRQPRACSGDM